MVGESDDGDIFADLAHDEHDVRVDRVRFRGDGDERCMFRARVDVCFGLPDVAHEDVDAQVAETVCFGDFVDDDGIGDLMLVEPRDQRVRDRVIIGDEHVSLHRVRQLARGGGFFLGGDQRVVDELDDHDGQDDEQENDACDVDDDREEPACIALESDVAEPLCGEDDERPVDTGDQRVLSAMSVDDHEDLEQEGVQDDQDEEYGEDPEQKFAIGPRKSRFYGID